MHAVDRQSKVDANELRKAAGHWLRRTQGLSLEYLKEL